MQRYRSEIKSPIANRHNSNPIFQRETCIVTEPGQYVYTGRAILEVKIQNEEQEKKLKDWSYKSRIDGFKLWEGVEISFHKPSLHECQKCKMSGRQEKSHHDDWCNIGNQITNNPNNHYQKNQAPIMPATRKTMTKQQAISFVMVPEMKKRRMLTHHHLEF